MRLRSPDQRHQYRYPSGLVSTEHGGRPAPDKSSFTQRWPLIRSSTFSEEVLVGVSPWDRIAPRRSGAPHATAFGVNGSHGVTSPLQ